MSGAGRAHGTCSGRVKGPWFRLLFASLSSRCPQRHWFSSSSCWRSRTWDQITWGWKRKARLWDEIRAGFKSQLSGLLPTVWTWASGLGFLIRKMKTTTMSPSCRVIVRTKHDVCEAPSLGQRRRCVRGSDCDAEGRRRWERQGMAFIPSSCFSRVVSALTAEGRVLSLALFSLLGERERLG